MRILACLVATLVVAGALAGCSGQPKGSTARSLLSTAQDAGAAWKQDAALVGVAAYEARNGTEIAARMREDSNHTHAEELALLDHDDAKPGDGHAPAWHFAFASKSDNRTLDLVLDASGSKLFSEEGNHTGAEGIAMEHWKLDSDEAWQVAADKNATMRQAVAGNGTATIAALVQVQALSPHPVWLLLAEDARGHDKAALLVDAENGTLYDFDAYIQEILRGLIPGVQESGSMSGILRPLAPAQDVTIGLGSPYHRQLVVALSASDTTAPGQQLLLVLKDATGKAVLYLNHTRATAAFDTPGHVALDRPTVQDYTATVSLGQGTSGIAAEFRLSWCTDGQGVPQFLGAASAACEFVVDQ